MLTQLLRDNPDLAERMRLLALVEARDCPSYADLLAPPRTKNYALVGTAADYLFRWNLERLNPLAKDQEWIASLALKNGVLDLPGVPPELPPLYRAVVAEATAFHSRFVRTPDPLPAETLDRAVVYCLCLAKVDPLFRTGTVTDDVNRYDALDVEDVRRVFAITPWNELGGATGTVPRLNPSFGSVSTVFNGADADLVVDSTLVDFKTVKASSGLSSELVKYVPQLLGYVMISDRYRETEDPSFPRLTRAGIYFARHGKLVTFPLEYVRLDANYDSVRDELFRTAVETFGTQVPVPVAKGEVEL